jgi:hypothetical protein
MARDHASGRIFPTWAQISELRQPPTPGELALAHHLDSELPADWEIFVQPYMNGDRPDIVVLNKQRGLVVMSDTSCKSGEGVTS